MSELALDALSGVTVGSYRLLRLIEHTQTGATYFANTTTGPATYRLRFLVDFTNLHITGLLIQMTGIECHLLSPPLPPCNYNSLLFQKPHKRKSKSSSIR